MEAIEIRNVRSLTKSGHIRLAPITLLVGQNSSGKSTFVRFLPMLKQGAEARTREPFLWLGRLVDFGSAEEAYSRFSDDRKLGITLRVAVPAPVLDGRRRAYIQLGDGVLNELVDLSIDYQFSEKAPTPTSYEYRVKYREQEITVQISDQAQITSFRINGTERRELAAGLVARWVGPVPTFESIDVEAITGKGAYAEIFRFVQSNLDRRTGIERAQRLTRTLTLGAVENLYIRAIEATAGDEYWRRQVKNWGMNSPNLKNLAQLVIAYQFFNEIATAFAIQTRRTLSNVRYITPIRASAERYYRLQGLSIEEIDPQGENVAMFLHTLSTAEKESFGKWTRSFFGIEVITQTSRGHVSLFLKGDDSSGAGFNLADTGFGYSQMLPILVQLWSIGHRKRLATQNTGPTIFAIEQPELHLHPKLQARLADVFIQAINAAKEIGVDLRLIVETHSEQLISALGLRIAQKNAVAARDVNVVLFEKERLDSPTNVSSAEFSSNGTLDSWPYGFFDASL